jgi:hypothetical protein
MKTLFALLLMTSAALAQNGFPYPHCDRACVRPSWSERCGWCVCPKGFLLNAEQQMCFAD